MATSLAPTDIVPTAPAADTPVRANDLTGTSSPISPEALTPVNAILRSPTERLPTEPIACTPVACKLNTAVPTSPEASTPVIATVLLDPGVPTTPAA